MLSIRRPQSSAPTEPVVASGTLARGVGLVAASGAVGALAGILLAVLDGSGGFAAWTAMLGLVTGLLVGATSVLGAATVLVLVPAPGRARSAGAALAAAAAGALTTVVVLAGLDATERGVVATAVLVAVLGTAAALQRRYSM